MIGDVVLARAGVRLRPVQEADLPHFQQWLNDPDVYQWLAGGVLAPPAWEDELRWWRRAHTDTGEVTWSIETSEAQLLGNLTLHWSPPATSATFGLFIGDRAQWDKGFGQAAVRALVGHCFRDLGLNRVGLNCDATNARAIRCYEKSGFRREGVMREHRCVDGEFRDSVIMGLLRKEWSDV